MRVFLLYAALICLASAKGAQRGQKRLVGQFPTYPQCEFTEGSKRALSVVETEQSHSCEVTNYSKDWVLTRVMCGGTNDPKNDHDVATYVYLDPESKYLALPGRCGSGGHRCQICGMKVRAQQSGDNVNGQTVLEDQPYECRRRCQVVLYQHEDFNGVIQTFAHNTPDTKLTALEGKISAMKIIGKDCNVRVWAKAGFTNGDGGKYDKSETPLCTFDSGKYEEVTFDMDDIEEKCKKAPYCSTGHDCIRSMAIRESNLCGPGKIGTECEVCKPGQSSLKDGCCIKRDDHSSGLTRVQALERLFTAMASVLEE